MHFFTASLIELLFISHYIYYIENITSITRYIFSVGEEIGTEKKKTFSCHILYFSVKPTKWCLSC